MLITYLVIACFASAFAATTESQNPLIAGVIGLLWPLFLVAIIFTMMVSR